MKVLFVGSGGGHLSHLLHFSPLWADFQRVWVCDNTLEVRARLFGERLIPMFSPTNRSLKNLALNCGLAARVLREEQPDLVVSAGAAVALPFFMLAYRQRRKSIYIEVIDRVVRPSLSARLVAPMADQVWVFHEQQARHFKNSVLLVKR